ncbi:MAG: sigma-54-dependent Fis family transcriptional regulator [Epsilonproteobacteria bacterium]|nr:sigma-54-dependent Fis family transcriptional regulator [Campylobacterota bacterium]
MVSESVDFIYRVSKSLKNSDLKTISYEIVNELFSYFGFSTVSIIIEGYNRKQRIVSCMGNKNSTINMIEAEPPVLHTEEIITIGKDRSQNYGFSDTVIIVVLNKQSGSYILIEGDDLLLKSVLTTIKIVANLLEIRLKTEKDRKILATCDELKHKLSKDHRFPEIIGESNQTKQIFSLISNIANSNSSVMLHGESGTGKELIAKAIHYSSGRKEKEFVAINCAAIPESLFESELFGFEKGSFTGAAKQKKGLVELADGGTLFFDEIGEMPLSMQPKLLRLIQEKTVIRIGGTKNIPVDFRLISATNKNLENMIKTGRFREDLYYRINVIPINIPKLSEHREDIPLLIEHFRNLFCKANNKSVKFAPEVIETLMKYSWPGNVRELENIVERLIVMAPPLSSTIKGINLSEIVPSIEHQDDMSLKQIEKNALLRALKAASGNKEQALRFLDITLRQLNYKIEKYKINIRDFQ